MITPSLLPLVLILLFDFPFLVFARNLTYQSLNPILYPDAVCNDGTTAGFYFAPSGTPSPTTLFIYLQSGGWCYDEDTCAARMRRSPYLMSSASWDSTTSVGGIFDSPSLPSSSTFVVDIPYCTSDGHMGNSAPTSTPYSFRGSAVVAAVIDTLLSTPGLSPARVVFGGASAGARGAMVHLDYAASKFAPAETVGVLDSPLWVDLPPPATSTSKGLLYQTSMVYGLVNASAAPAHLLSRSCKDAHKDTPHYCLFGEYRLPHVATRHLLISAQFDSYQLEQDVSNPLARGAFEFDTAFGEKMHDTFVQFESDQSDNWYYSQPCYDHAISTSSSFFTLLANKFSEDDAVTGFLEGGTKQPSMVDFCKDGLKACTKSGTYCPSNK